MLSNHLKFFRKELRGRLILSIFDASNHLKFIIMENLSKLFEQLNRIEKNQEKILEFLKEFKSDTFTNFQILASDIRNIKK